MSTRYFEKLFPLDDLKTSFLIWMCECECEFGYVFPFVFHMECRTHIKKIMPKQRATENEFREAKLLYWIFIIARKLNENLNDLIMKKKKQPNTVPSAWVRTCALWFRFDFKFKGAQEICLDFIVSAEQIVSKANWIGIGIVLLHFMIFFASLCGARKSHSHDATNNFEYVLYHIKCTPSPCMVYMRFRQTNLNFLLLLLSLSLLLLLLKILNSYCYTSWAKFFFLCVCLCVFAVYVW